MLHSKVFFLELQVTSGARVAFRVEEHTLAQDVAMAQQPTLNHTARVQLKDIIYANESVKTGFVVEVR